MFIAIFICGTVGYGLQFGGTGAAMAIAWVFSVVGSCLAFGVVWAARREIRTKQGIKGTDGEDCCLSFWCNSCSVCQILNNVKGRYQGAPCPQRPAMPNSPVSVLVPTLRLLVKLRLAFARRGGSRAARGQADLGRLLTV